YPDAKLADLGALVKRARDNRIDFVFALSPGLSICYSSATDYAALTAKFESLYKLGVRSFAIPFDDIDPGQWHCQADKNMYGDGKGAEGRAQADLLNRVQREWVAGKGDVAPLQMVPTEYDNVTESPYKKAIRERLDRHVLVHWTGVAVIPHKITRDQASQARTVFGHKIIVWDNYPVNDYIAGRLPLGPYTGREPGLSQQVAGVLSNPMNQPGPSKIGLFSIAEFGWNDESYDAWKSYDRSLTEEAGGDARVATALGWFADLNYYDGTLHYERAPRLAAALADFWADWQDGDATKAASRLRPTLAALAKAPEVIRQGVDDPAFTQQAEPWLDAAELLSKAMQDSLDTLVALDGNEPATAWAMQEEARALVAHAGEIRDSRSPHAGTAPLVGDGVVDRFVTEVARRFDASEGVGLDEVAAQTSLGTYDGKDAMRMIDGDKNTAFISDAAPRTGDYVQVDLRRVRPIGDVTVTMTRSAEPHDFLQAGTLEYSTNGSTWHLLAHGDSAEVRAHPPAGTRARYVRYRATRDNGRYWLAVREFKVALPDRMTLSVDGPDGADNSSPSAAVDDDLSSAYVPDDEASADGKLVVTLSRPRAVDKVTVLQQKKSGGSGAQVEVRVDGSWTRIGTLAGEFTQLPVVGGGKVDGVRLAWTSERSAPSVAEIVPHYGED
ncbi:MAG TPA: beta-N-acetylglucosaminidase domain-containing protein, partial [Actinopolymorphaceae bacterium]|nr:beta-N-acetylglucosaminidase domain-containing protein [Actinopolymorphaceae bacterium]